MNKHKSWWLGIILASMAGLMNGCATSSRPGTEHVGEHKQYSPKKAANMNAELAISYTQKHMYDRAKKMLQRAEQFDDGQLPSVLYARGFYYQNIGMESRANDAYKEALKRAPGDPRTMVMYAQFLCKKTSDNYDVALELFNDAVASPNNDELTQTFLLYGDCLMSHDQDAQAKKMFQRVTQQAGSHPTAHWALANIYFHEKQYKKAEHQIQRVLQTGQPNRDLLELQYQVLKALGKTDQAMAVRLKLNSMSDEEIKAW